MAGRIPHEFDYWRNLERPRVRLARRALRAVLGFDPAPDDDVVRTLAAMYYDADPIAEAFVEEVCLGRGMAVGRAMLDQALADGVASVRDAPASLVALFADIERNPPWVDLEQVERGARAFRRFGVDVFRFAGAITLLAYSESSVAKPLALTGAYAGSTARHRFLETAAFWIAVSNPGGLRPGAAGRAAALRVRIMHVFVRQRLLRHPEWNREAWGVPINQSDALLTLLGGSFAPGLALRVLGHRPSRADIEAMMHYWRYVGHLMGVRPRWYPTSLRDAVRLSFVTFVKASHRAGDDGRKLCRAYANAFAPSGQGGTLERARDAVEHGVHLGFTRLFVPGARYRYNQMPPAGAWTLYPLARAPLVFAAESLRRAVPALDDVADRVQRRRRDRWFARHMGERSASYQPVQRFTR